MHPLQYQYLRAAAHPYHVTMDPKLEPRIPVEDTPSPPLELRRDSRRTPHERVTDSPQIGAVYMMHGAAGRLGPPQFSSTTPNSAPTYFEPPPAHLRPQYPMPSVSEGPVPERVLTPDRDSRNQLVGTPSHPQQPSVQGDSPIMMLNRYHMMWQGILALKNDQAAVQMHYVWGNIEIAGKSLLRNSDGSTPPLRIAQRMRLEQTQLEPLIRKMLVSFQIRSLF